MQLLYNRYYVRAASKRAIQRFEREARKIRKNVLKNRDPKRPAETQEISFSSTKRGMFFRGRGIGILFLSSVLFIRTIRLGFSNE